MLSEAITSKRFKKAHKCPTEISFTLLSKLKYSAHVQVSHLSDSGEAPQPEPAELLGNTAELLHGHNQVSDQELLPLARQSLGSPRTKGMKGQIWKDVDWRVFWIQEDVSEREGIV